MVEGGRLESDYTSNGIGGSNPLSSGFLRRKKTSEFLQRFCVCKIGFAAS